MTPAPSSACRQCSCMCMCFDERQQLESPPSVHAAAATQRLPGMLLIVPSQRSLSSQTGCTWGEEGGRGALPNLQKPQHVFFFFLASDSLWFLCAQSRTQSATRAGAQLTEEWWTPRCPAPAVCRGTQICSMTSSTWAQWLRQTSGAWESTPSAGVCAQSSCLPQQGVEDVGERHTSGKLVRIPSYLNFPTLVTQVDEASKSQRQHENTSYL